MSGDRRRCPITRILRKVQTVRNAPTWFPVLTVNIVRTFICHHSLANRSPKEIPSGTAVRFIRRLWCPSEGNISRKSKDRRYHRSSVKMAWILLDRSNPSCAGRRGSVQGNPRQHRHTTGIINIVPYICVFRRGCWAVGWKWFTNSLCWRHVCYNRSRLPWGS